MSADGPKVTEKLRAEARRNPGKWVYVVDPEFDASDAVPPHGIAGAWRVSDEGQIVGDFVSNESYIPSPTGRGWRETKSDLERQIQLCSIGIGSVPEVFAKFLGSRVWVYNDGVSPAFHIVDLADGVQTIYAFTDSELAVASGWAEVREIAAAELASSLPLGVKIVLNAGSDASVVLDPPADFGREGVMSS